MPGTAQLPGRLTGWADDCMAQGVAVGLSNTNNQQYCDFYCFTSVWPCPVLLELANMHNCLVV